VANSAQARKRARQSENRRQRNASARSRMRTTLKKTEGAIVSGEKETAVGFFQESARSVDSAVTKGLLHKNTAARKKSRLNTRLRAMA
jgi:small subunit ribosomal protein S20